MDYQDYSVELSDSDAEYAGQAYDRAEKEKLLDSDLTDRGTGSYDMFAPCTTESFPNDKRTKKQEGAAGAKQRAAQKRKEAEEDKENNLGYGAQPARTAETRRKIAQVRGTGKEKAQNRNIVQPKILRIDGMTRGNISMSTVT